MGVNDVSGGFGPAVSLLTRHSTAQVTVGTINQTENGEVVYIGAGGAITASGDPVSVAGALSACVRGDLDVGVCAGMAEAPFASGEYGWIRKSGPCSMVVESGAAAGVGVQLSSTVGKLKAITTSGTQIGVMLEASDDAGTARKSVYLQIP